MNQEYNIFISSMGILDTPGKRISALINDEDITQAELARRVGISEQYMSKIVRDRAPRPSVVVMCAIARELGSTVGYIMGDHDDPLPPPEIQLDNTDPELRKVFEQVQAFFNTLPPGLYDHTLESLKNFIQLLESATGPRARQRNGQDRPPQPSSG